MKKILFLIVCLALMSLACLQTAMVSDPLQTGTATPAVENVKESLEPTAGEIGLDTPATNTQATRPAELSCAKVIAIKALHLRASGSDKAAVVAWLENGDMVQMKSTADPDWWFVEYAGMMGYARSEYLEEVECVS